MRQPSIYPYCRMMASVAVSSFDANIHFQGLNPILLFCDQGGSTARVMVRVRQGPIRHRLARHQYLTLEHVRTRAHSY